MSNRYSNGLGHAPTHRAQENHALDFSQTMDIESFLREVAKLLMVIFVTVLYNNFK